MGNIKEGGKGVKVVEMCWLPDTISGIHSNTKDFKMYTP